jgi:dihydropteroate synthase
VAVEIQRTFPVIEALSKRLPKQVISIDTQKSEVAEAALRAGATVVNDVSGLNRDPKLARVVADSGAWLILGHMRGQPKNMQKEPSFKDVVKEVGDELLASVELALRAGVSRDRIVIDPGLGFGKTAEDTLRLLANLNSLRQRLKLPLLIGASRKSFLGTVTGATVDHRAPASHAADAIAVFLGAEAVRVHDVAGAVQAVAVALALRSATDEENRFQGSFEEGEA